MNYVVLPYRSDVDGTLLALRDALNQSIDTRVILINNGGPRLVLSGDAASRVYEWGWTPPLPLAAVWNLALDYVWANGGREALVINNDIRMRRDTYAQLHQVAATTRALFVSPVNVGEAGFSARTWVEPVRLDYHDVDGRPHPTTSGGPDFSCYLITKECHASYRFDEGFTPAYCEDLDYHRRMLLNGDGSKIFSVPFPYWHKGSGTLNSVDAETRQEIEAAISAGSRAHYRRKWGGDVNQEIYSRPFDETSRGAGVTTPELQRKVQHG